MAAFRAHSIYLFFLYMQYLFIDLCDPNSCDDCSSVNYKSRHLFLNTRCHPVISLQNIFIVQNSLLLSTYFFVDPVWKTNKHFKTIFLCCMPNTNEGCTQGNYAMASQRTNSTINYIYIIVITINLLWLFKLVVPVIQENIVLIACAGVLLYVLF